MINITEKYPPAQPLPKGPVFLSFDAWAEAKAFLDSVTWPEGTDVDKEIIDRIHNAVRSFYGGRFHERSEWFRKTPKHNLAVLAYDASRILFQVSTVCSDGLAICTHVESSAVGGGLNDEYFARAAIEQTYVDHRDAFVREPSGA